MIVLFPAQIQVGELAHTLNVGISYHVDDDEAVTIVLSAPAKRRDRAGQLVIVAEKTCVDATDALLWLDEVAPGLGAKLDAQHADVMQRAGYR